MIDCLYRMLRGVLFRLDARDGAPPHHRRTPRGLRARVGSAACGCLGARAVAGAGHGTHVSQSPRPRRPARQGGCGHRRLWRDGLRPRGGGHHHAAAAAGKSQAASVADRRKGSHHQPHGIQQSRPPRRAGQYFHPPLARHGGFNIGKNFDTPNDAAIADYRTCLAGAYAHVDYVTVNISSPNTKGLRDLQQEDAIRALMRSLKQEPGRSRSPSRKIHAHRRQNCARSRSRRAQGHRRHLAGGKNRRPHRDEYHHRPRRRRALAPGPRTPAV